MPSSAEALLAKSKATWFGALITSSKLEVSRIGGMKLGPMPASGCPAGPVNDNMSTVVQAQLMYLDSLDNMDITMHIDSPGGSVKSGLSMIDVMQYINSDIITVNTGMAASI